ncbi:restriction endonuclease subunit S [Oceanisphaera avium]|uniref:Type I restriction modification DNA specificity domain-containing protein n=1 Tax=Oceanisphaera avium TaxID=1903694 RepID=A0A1Y0D0F3_9GAMM|nr:restriction endonuclease subunit S [Oceanisphaera avium]ART80495.1 hypothetical protein CBP12_10385 [Oceanisphaera avium]
MSADWPLHSLSEFIGIKHGFAFKGEFFQSEESSDFLVTPGNFSVGGGFKSDKFKYYDGPVPEDYVLKEGDLVVTMTDLSKQADTLGYSALIPTINGHRLLHNQRVGLVEYKNNELDKNYLYFLLRSTEYRNHVLGGVTGTTVKHTSPTKILSYEFRKPPFETQVEIGRKLITLEYKVDLNRQTNQTLEQIAQAIFKSWFVDFEPTRAKIIAKAQGADPATQELAAQAIICGAITLEQLAELEQSLSTTLQAAINQKLSQQSSTSISADQLIATAALFPNELVESNLTYKPYGWNVGKIQDCCKRVESGGTPKRSESAYWSGDIKWLSSGEVRDVIVLDTKEKITKLGLDKSSAKLWPQGTTVVAMYGATAGQVCLLADEMTANQACCALIPKENYMSYVFLAARRSIEDLAGKASGSAQQNLNKTLVSEHELLLPSVCILEKFELVMSSLIKKWIYNCKENIELSEVRDTLLPKLLSGELTFEAAE